MPSPINRDLAVQKKTDFDRWSDMTAFQRTWDARARLAAQYITDGTHILDLGCGRMALRRFLPPRCVYRGCDLVARDDDTVVCNFNAGEFPEEVSRKVDVIVLLGVLEYIVDVDAFFDRLRYSNRDVVLSYSPREWSSNIDRAALGWFNALSLDELAAIFRRFGFAIVRFDQVDRYQVLVKLQPLAYLDRLQKLDSAGLNSVSYQFERLGTTAPRPAFSSSLRELRRSVGWMTRALRRALSPQR
jgi:methyltransferase family protein